MKNIVLLSLLAFFTICTEAQKVKLGISGQTLEFKLEATDQLQDNRYFKYFSVPMKKNDAVVFVMKSRDFTPFLALATSNAGVFKSDTGRLNDNGEKEAMVSFETLKDSLELIVVFSSVEPNKTGTYTYTYKAPDRDQLFFSHGFSFCDRLTYLINNWQLYWEFAGKKYINEDDEGYTSKSVETYQTLINGNKANLTNGYTEDLYSNVYYKPEFESMKKEFMDHYKDITAKIEACLDKNLWIVEKHETVTHYILTGGKKKERLKSFYVELYIPKLIEGIYVRLHFN